MSEFRPTGRDDAADFAMMEPADRLRAMLEEQVRDRPFSELSPVTFDHDGAELIGHVMLDALEEKGYSVDDFDAAGALTAAAVPIVCAVMAAATSRGESLDGFVMDFVYPSIKGPSIKGKRVMLVDSWLSNKSYVQTSSLVTLRNGNELGLDFGIVEAQGATVVGITSLIGADTSELHVVNPSTAQAVDMPFLPIYTEAELRVPEED
ncbi:MAG: orotate phosphoribosyltransferase [Bifidobacterium sp.]|nr:orotate phosphoribosyltransferase [Bifidobacterium sp.]